MNRIFSQQQKSCWAILGVVPSDQFSKLGPCPSLSQPSQLHTLGTRVWLHNRPVCPHLWCLQTRVSVMTPRAPCHLTRGLRWNKQQQSVLLCKGDVNWVLPRSRLIYFLRGSSLIIFCCLLREVGPGSRLFIMRNVIIVIFWGFSSLTMTPDILHVSGCLDSRVMISPETRAGANFHFLIHK